MEKAFEKEGRGHTPEIKGGTPSGAGPLEGLKVLDLGVAGAGPIGPTLLAELGAEVIKIEMPGMGTLLRRVPPLCEGTSLWRMIELRNKKSLELDLHTDEGQELIRRLVREYDILIENYRPGTLERWNLGYEELQKVNPGVILVRVSGFGQEGPYRRRTSYDTIGVAMGGLTHITGYPDGPPALLGLAYCDYVSAAFNTLAALIAVYHRHRTGEGQWADIPQYEAIFRLSEFNVAAYDQLGLVRGRTGNRHPSIAPGDLFTTRDGQLVAIVAGNDSTFVRLCRAMGREDLPQDPRFETLARRAERADSIHEIVGGWVKEKGLDELAGILDEAEVPYSPVLSIREIFEDPHIRARGNLLEVEDPIVGRVKVPNVVPRFSRTPGRIRDTGPALGEHNQEIRARFDGGREAGRPTAAGGPVPSGSKGREALAGLRVLDLGQGIAGPFGATLLADFGAEVIKVEEPGRGDDLRHTPPFSHGVSLWWAVDGRNKKSVTLDLREEGDREAFQRLVGVSDVLIESLHPGTLERWNLGYEELKEVNPGIILARVSGFGQDGPYRHRPACDAVGTAMGGLTYLTGFPDRPPVKPSISVADYLCGIFTAISVMAALRHRDRTGEGQWIDLALYEPFLRISHDNIPAYDKLGLVRERLGNAVINTRGQHLYQAGDGKWIAILGQTEDKDFGRLAQAIGREELSRDPRFRQLVNRMENYQALNEIIASWVKGLAAREALETLVEHQVPAGLVYDIRDIFEDPHYRARGNILEVEDPVLGRLKMQDVVPKLSRTPGKVKWAGPRLGQHNAEILGDLPGLIREGSEMVAAGDPPTTPRRLT